MKNLHLKPIGLNRQVTQTRPLNAAPSLSCSYTMFSYPITPNTPKLDATAKPVDQKRAAA